MLRKLWDKIKAPLATEAVIFLTAIAAGVDRLLEWVGNEQQWTWLASDWRIAVIAAVTALVARAKVWAQRTVEAIKRRVEEAGGIGDVPRDPVRPPEFP